MALASLAFWMCGTITPCAPLSRMRVASCGSCEVTRAIGVIPMPSAATQTPDAVFERRRVVLQVNIDRVEPAGGGDHRDVRGAQLVHPHAQHQLVVLQHPFGVIFADLRGHGTALLPETVIYAAR